MRSALGLLLAICVVRLQADQASLDALHKRILGLNTKVDSLLRQTVLSNLAIEENIRSESDSGVKTVHITNVGTKPYFSSALVFEGRGPGSLVISKLNNKRVWSSSLHALLNGVDFKIRGQAFNFQQPSSTTKDYLKLEDMKMPEVPPQVLQKKTVEEQTKEMIEWFKAFQANDYKTRDFRKFFKPVICYLEGWWESTDFRRFRIRDERNANFMARGGWRLSNSMSQSEPKEVWDTTNGTEYSRWRSRIACQPVKNMDNLRPNRFIPIDDLSTRVEHNRTFGEHVDSPLTRFIVNPADSDRFSDRSHRNSLLDKLMENVPGLDNHKANLRDIAFDLPVQRFDNSKVPLNTGFYHRFYKVLRVGAMGSFDRHRGYTDASIFMAQTSQNQVAGQSVEDCKYVSGKRVCKTFYQKFSYAVPLMVVYLTPLNSWNPYKLIPVKTNSELFANGRSGRKNDPKSALNSYSDQYCLKIPSEFIGRHARNEPSRYVLSGGKVYRARGCGLRMFIQPNGLPPMRMAFPIFPMQHEGNAVMKEVAALQDLLLDEAKYKSLWRTQ